MPLMTWYIFVWLNSVMMMIRWKIHAYQSADPFNKKPFGIYWKFPFRRIGHFIFLGNSNGIYISRIKPISKSFRPIFAITTVVPPVYGFSIVMLYVPCIAMRYVLCDIMENNCVYVCRTTSTLHSQCWWENHAYSWGNGKHVHVCVCVFVSKCRCIGTPKALFTQCWSQFSHGLFSFRHIVWSLSFALASIHSS